MTEFTNVDIKSKGSCLQNISGICYACHIPFTEFLSPLPKPLRIMGIISTCFMIDAYETWRIESLAHD